MATNKTQRINVVLFDNISENDRAPQETGRIDIPVSMIPALVKELKAQDHREYNGQKFATLRLSLWNDRKGLKARSGVAEVLKPHVEQTKLAVEDTTEA